MKAKKLPSKDRLHQLFNYQDGQLIYKVKQGNRKKGDIAGCKFYDKDYVRINVDGISYTKHRLVYQYHHGNLTEEDIIDHIDRDPGNNSIENLRIVSKSINNLNSGLPKHNTHGYKGVSKNGNRFMARIMINGNFEYLGAYDTLEEAHQAYMKRHNEILKLSHP
tara:strand:+ start:86 stop:577 length:492 start_codon:yes stop_codon:yes gene_type:complete